MDVCSRCSSAARCHVITPLASLPYLCLLALPAAGDAGLRRLGAGAPVRRSTGDLSEFTGEAASQIA
jgi:hypothetical protein